MMGPLIDGKVKKGEGARKRLGLDPKSTAIGSSATPVNTDKADEVYVLVV